MISLQRFSALVSLCGTVVLAAWLPAGLAEVGLPAPNGTEAAMEEVRLASVTDRDEQVDAAQATRLGEDGVPLVDMGRVETALHDPDPLPTPTIPLVRIASPNMSDAVQNGTADAASSFEIAEIGNRDAPPANPDPMRPPTILAALSPADPMQESKPGASSFEVLEACPEPEVCIDQYLWSLYERAPKVDTAKVTERIKVTVKKKGKARELVKTLTKYVTQDFAWKDPTAAEKAGMSLKEYVIGGMDRSFKRKLYHALRAMDDAGLSPGITSGFRDDYRQALASGNKAATDSSYHGGSRRGGYGYGLAADLVSVKGETRAERIKSSQILWKWIDAHENELGIGRPYLDRDPPHVGPIDGKEYVQKRSRVKIKLTGSAQNSPKALAVHEKHAITKRAKAAKLMRVGS